MKIHALPSGPIQTVGYLLTDAARGQAVLIDAPGDILARIQPILAREGCKLRELWITHGHWDHIQEAAAVKAATDATLRIHRDDQVLLETPQIQDEFVVLFLGRRLDIPGVKADAWLKPGERLDALGSQFEVRHVPGHCPGNVLFYQAEQGVAFVGDTLFNGGVGRSDLPGGDADLLARSIREQIYTLPDDTAVFPGHGPYTVVGDEKETNPYVSATVP